MAINDRITLERLIEQQKAQRAPEASFQDYFESFLMEQVLKKLQPTDDEIDSGIVDGGDDGGVDGMYTFVNGKLVAEDTDFSIYRSDVALDLYIIQAKVQKSFSERPLDSFLDSVGDLLDLDRSLDRLKPYYNADLLRAVGRFRQAYEELASTFPRLRVWYVYGCLGETDDMHPKVVYKAGKLGEAVRGLFSDCDFRNSFWGASEILQAARRLPPSSLELRLTDNVTSTEDGGYLCLVNLQDYFDFITDGDGTLRNNIFESNVRDYEGNVGVNQGIAETLRGGGREDFWWLNNGVTVLASNANIRSRTLTLEDPQIVNGLQTSTEIYNYFSSEQLRPAEENRRVLVRVVATDDEASRDRIITATNSQTSLTAASLRAHDAMQRNIEIFFRSHGLFYDRRKNFYKNQGRPKDKIVSISYVAQAVTAMVLRKPNDSRARPSSLLKEDKVYREVFNPSHPLETYLACAKIMRASDAFIRSRRSGFSPEERNNLRFHLAMYAVAAKISRTSYTAEDVLEVDLDGLDEEFFASCAAEVVEEFRRKQTETNSSADQLAKSKEFVQATQQRLDERLHQMETQRG